MGYMGQVFAHQILVDPPGHPTRPYQTPSYFTSLLKQFYAGRAASNFKHFLNHFKRFSTFSYV